VLLNDIRVFWLDRIISLVLKKESAAVLLSEVRTVRSIYSLLLLGYLSVQLIYVQ